MKVPEKKKNIIDMLTYRSFKKRKRKTNLSTGTPQDWRNFRDAVKSATQADIDYDVTCITRCNPSLGIDFDRTNFRIAKIFDLVVPETAVMTCTLTYYIKTRKAEWIISSENKEIKDMSATSMQDVKRLVLKKWRSMANEE